jgi:hypothetical protein
VAAFTQEDLAALLKPASIREYNPINRHNFVTDDHRPNEMKP